MLSIYEGFVAWVRTKGEKEKYDYQSPGNCAFAQYLQDRGICDNPGVGITSWTDDEHKYHELPDWLATALPPPGSEIGTYGALLRRIEKARSKEHA